LLQYILEISGV